MIAYTATLEDTQILLTRRDNGDYLLQAVQNNPIPGKEPERFEKIISESEAAAILFASFDVSEKFDNVTDIHQVAKNCLVGFTFALIP